MILYNVPLNDLKVAKITDGHIFYNSLLLDQIWQMGYTTIGEVTPETCSYVAQYCVKKAFANVNTDFEELGIEKEFITMSRRPGIGYEWLMQHPEVLDHPVINVSSPSGGKKFVIPRYYLEKLSVLDKNKDFVELLKESKHDYYLQRLAIEDAMSSKPRLERLADAERVAEKSVRKEREIYE